jgi:hypothetical protein
MIVEIAGFRVDNACKARTKNDSKSTEMLSTWSSAKSTLIRKHIPGLLFGCPSHNCSSSGLLPRNLSVKTYCNLSRLYIPQESQKADVPLIIAALAEQILSVRQMRRGDHSLDIDSLDRCKCSGSSPDIAGDLRISEFQRHTISYRVQNTLVQAPVSFHLA